MNNYLNFPDDARVWVYASNRLLKAGEQEQIKTAASDFINRWTSHERKMEASFDLAYDAFLVLTLDESINQTSGCGIDKSVAFFKELEKQFGLTLFNRMQIELLTADGLIITDKAGASVLLAEGKITAETHTFNKLVTSFSQYKNHFKLPVSQSWYYPIISKQQTLA